MTPDEATKQRAALWRCNFRPVAVVDGNAPGPSPGKRPVGMKWQNEARRNPPLWATHPAVLTVTNTGILCDGLQAIDIDCDDPEIARWCYEFAVTTLGRAPVRFRRNSPRMLVLFRALEGEPSKRSIQGADHSKQHSCRIEVLGRGQQFVAFGIHDTGAPLEWKDAPAPGVITVAELPAVSEAQILEYLDRCAAIIRAPSPKANGQHDFGEHVAGKPDAEHGRIAAALDALTPDYATITGSGSR